MTRLGLKARQAMFVVRELYHFPCHCEQGASRRSVAIQLIMRVPKNYRPIRGGGLYGALFGNRVNKIK